MNFQSLRLWVNHEAMVTVLASLPHVPCLAINQDRLSSQITWQILYNPPVRMLMIA